jgi:NAD(P)-dependent dehydrogenase (short-subunit alcohol dehydrogenase family)
LGSFTERVALVTNAAHGVGRAVAMQLALAGAYVVAHYRADDEAGAHVVGQLEAIGTLGRGAAGDVTNAQGAAAVVAQVEEIYGRLDLLVCVAPPVSVVSLDEYSENEWRRAWDETLHGAFFCAQAAARLLRERPAPCIVNVWAAETGAAGAALGALTEQLAAELAPRVRVNGVAARGNPPPDDTARVCCYLLSSEAKCVSGEIITAKPRANAEARTK